MHTYVTPVFSSIHYVRDEQQQQQQKKLFPNFKSTKNDNRERRKKKKKRKYETDIMNYFIKKKICRKSMTQIILAIDTTHYNDDYH